MCLQVKGGNVSTELDATKRDVLGHRLALLRQHPVLQTYFQNAERWRMFIKHILSRTACFAVLCCWSGSTFENCAVLDCDAASCCNSLPTFWDNRSYLQASDRFPEMIVRNHHHSLRRRPEERCYQLLRDGSRKSLINICS